MRDPARIDRMLALLEVYWKKHPDLRIGQIICTMHARYGESIDPRTPPSVFTLEDSDYEAMLTKELGLLTALAAVSQDPQPRKETKMSRSSSSSSKPSSRSRRGKA